MAQGKNIEMDLRIAEEHATLEEIGAAEDTRPLEWLIVVARRKFFILTFAGSAAVLSLLVSFLIPVRYTANCKLLPPQQSQSMSMSAVLSQLGPLQALIGGGGMGIRNANDFYIGMLRSRTVADGLIDRFDLMRVYKKKVREDARTQLAGRTEILASKDGVISIFVEDHDPQRAADLANAYANELEKLTKTLAVTEAARRRLFFEHETKIASDELAVAEQGLKETQEKTGLILLDSQSRAMIDALTSLRARVAAQEVMVRAMQSFATDENPDLVRAKEELAALRDQETKLEFGHGGKTIANVPIENVPTAGLEYVRKFREVKYHEALFELLAKQYEAARIDEGRDSVLVQQLDKALLPERRSWPKRLPIIVFSALAALLVSVFWVLLGAAMERAKENPQVAAKLHLLRQYLFAGPKS